jgi:hypothetical protein
VGTLSLRKREAIAQALDWIRSNSDLDENGKVKITVGIPYYASKELLTSLTLGETNLPERTHRRAVNLAVNRWRKYKKYQRQEDSPKSFFEALNIEASKIERATRDFKIVMFINLDEKELARFEPLHILGDQLDVSSWQDVGPLSDEPEWQRLWFQDRSNPIFWPADREKPMPNFNVFTPVSIRVRTFDEGAAVSMASDRFDVLRAIINISALLGRFSYFRSRPSHLSLVLPTPIYLIGGDEGVTDIWFTVEKYQYKKAKLKQDLHRNIEYLLPIFADEIEESSSHQHLLGIMRLYQDAVDSTHTRPAYLSMWQVVESAVSFPGERLRQSDVISRVATLTKIDPLYKSALDLLKDIRNSLVHSGEFLDRSDDLFFTLKIIADECILRLISLCREYPTLSQLKEYLRCASTNTAELEDKSTVLSKLLQQRDSKQ